MKELFEKLIKLTSLPGVSGQETQVSEFLKNEMAKISNDCFIDDIGNVFALFKGTRPGPRLFISAHTDQIGMCVKYIDEKGYIYFEKIGGLTDALVCARKVKIGPVKGVTGIRPGHYQTPEERTRVIPSDKLYIDVGAETRDDVTSMGIRIGDQITFDDEITIFNDGYKYAGAAVDDRAGCAVLWQLAYMLENRDFAGEVYLGFTVSEEVGLRGAYIAANRIKPDMAIAVDTIPCGGTPDTDEREISSKIGRGPVFAWVTGKGGTFSVPAKMKKMLLKNAIENNIPYQEMVFCAGDNDASSMQMAGSGILSASIAIPRKYSHSPVETGDIRDLDHIIKLLYSIIYNMD